ERLRDLNRDPQRLVERQRTFAQARRQCFPLQVLHHEEIDALVMAKVVKRADVRMGEPRDGTSLVRQTRPPARVRGALSGQDFPRAPPTESRIAGAINLAHAASAREALDLKDTDSCAGRQDLRGG